MGCSYLRKDRTEELEEQPEGIGLRRELQEQWVVDEELEYGRPIEVLFDELEHAETVEQVLPDFSRASVQVFQDAGDDDLPCSLRDGEGGDTLMR